MDDLLAVGYRHMQAVAERGRRPLAVHVGADGLMNGARWTDVHLWSRVLNRTGLPPGLLRLAFVEPIEAKSRTFWTKVKRLPVNRSQVSLHTAMVDGNCEAAEEVLYRLSPRASEDFGFNDVMFQGWVSSTASHPFNVLEGYVRRNGRVGCRHIPHGDCRENLKSFWSSPSRDSYFESVAIPCHSVASLVQTSGAELRDLSMLVVDAEGMETRILLGIAGQADFRPGFIMWEGGALEAPELQELHRVLRSKGYAIGVKTGAKSKLNSSFAFGTPDALNYVAVLEG